MRAIITILCLFCIPGVGAQDQESPGKKEQKEVSRIFGEETNFRMVQFSTERTTLHSLLKEGDAVFEVVQDEQVLGYLLSTQAKGRFDLFDYSVIYSDELEVLSMMILVYRSTHGAGVCSKHWLKQFKGYSGGKLTLGKEIDTISGATLSAASLVRDAERCYQLMAALKNMKVIH